MNLRILPAARQDLIAIDDYLLEAFGPAVAARTQEKLRATFHLLARFQQMGTVRPDITNRPVRFFSHPPYWIVYRPGTPLCIYRVYHAARDLSRLHIPGQPH